MRVYIPKHPNKYAGSTLFCNRLAEELRNQGVEIVSSNSASCDVSLNCVTLKRYKSRKKILRLDNVYHNCMEDYTKRNTPIIRSLERADGVVYQSDFSRRLCDVYLGNCSAPFTIIPNGMNPEIFSGIDPAPKEADFSFLTTGLWRPHKRLFDIIESFLLADIKGSVLYIAGGIWKNTVSSSSLRKYTTKSNIKYLGKVDQKTLASYLKIVDGFVYLSWIDSCPNSVVEAICAGVPVLTNNVGGTQELVRQSGKGYVLDLDEPYDFRPVRLYEPPAIDRSLVASAMVDCCKLIDPHINKSYVDIRNVAQKYKDFFCSILRGD